MSLLPLLLLSTALQTRDIHMPPLPPSTDESAAEYNDDSILDQALRICDAKRPSGMGDRQFLSPLIIDFPRCTYCHELFPASKSFIQFSIVSLYSLFTLSPQYGFLYL